MRAAKVDDNRKETPLGKKMPMVRNSLGYHIKTDRPLIKYGGEQVGVYAACGGGLFFPLDECRRVRPTCVRCRKIWVANEIE